MDSQKFCLELDELFELEPGTVSLSDKLTEIPGWDSMLFLGVLAHVDDEYGVTLAPQAVLGQKNIQGIVDLIDDKNGNRAAA